MTKYKVRTNKDKAKTKEEVKGRRIDSDKVFFDKKGIRQYMVRQDDI